jgi:cell division protein FtsB
LSKVVATYWDNTHEVAISAQTRLKTVKRSRASVTPQWLTFTIIVLITFMVCITVNFRAYSEMIVEVEQNGRLSIEVEQLNKQNLIIQEQIHDLKTDSRAIEHEAQKIGLSRRSEKILVSIN